MQIIEFSKRSGFALGLTMTPPTADAFADEMRLAKQALLDWKANRGTCCDRVMFTVVCPSEHHPAIEDAISQIYEHEAQLAPLLHSVDMDVALLTPGGRGRPEKEYRLDRTAGHRRPWWKFW